MPGKLPEYGALSSTLEKSRNQDPMLTTGEQALLVYCPCSVG